MNGTTRRENCLRLAENRRAARDRRVMQRIVTVINRGEDPASWNPFQLFVKTPDSSTVNKSSCLSKSVYYRLAHDPNWSWDWEWLLSEPLKDFDPFAYYRLQRIRAGERLSDDAWSDFAYRYRSAFVASEGDAADEQDLASAVAFLEGLAQESPANFLSQSPGPSEDASPLMAGLRWVDYYLLALRNLVQRRGSAAEREPEKQDWILAARTAAEGWQVVQEAERATHMEATFKAGSGRSGLAWEWAYCLARSGAEHEEIQRLVASAARSCDAPGAMLSAAVAVALLDKAYSSNSHTRAEIHELSKQLLATESAIAHTPADSPKTRQQVNSPRQLRAALEKKRNSLGREERDATRRAETLVSAVQDSYRHGAPYLLDLLAEIDSAACRYEFARDLRIDWSNFSCAEWQLAGDDPFHQAGTRQVACQVALFWLRGSNPREREAAMNLLIQWTVEEFWEIGRHEPAPNIIRVPPSVVEAVLNLYAEGDNEEEVRNLLEKLRLLLADPQSKRWPRVERAHWGRIMNRFRDYLRPRINLAPARRALNQLSDAFQQPGTLRAQDLVTLRELHEEFMQVRAQALVSLELKVNDQAVVIPGDRFTATQGTPVAEWCHHGQVCALDRLNELEDERRHFKATPRLQR